MTDEFADWAVTALSALAHESRLQVHRLLVQAGEDGLSAGSNRRANLASRRRRCRSTSPTCKPPRWSPSAAIGRSLIYTVNFECMDALMAYLQENCCKGVTTAAITRPSTSRQKVRS